MDLLRDLVIIVPGICGSVLEKDGKKVWDTSRGTLWRTLTNRGAGLRALAFDNDDDPSLDDLGDGVTATELMPPHLVPGLSKFDGYVALRRLVSES
jgi:hypothetical protein